MTKASKPKIMVYSIIGADNELNGIAADQTMKDIDSLIQSIISQYPQQPVADGMVLSMRLRASEIEFVIERRPCECGHKDADKTD
jgi:hypothetical protein